MIRLLAAAALLAGQATVAEAQAPGCMDTTASWTKTYSQGTIQAVTYFVWHQSPPAQSKRPPVLSVLFFSGDLHIHVNVPNNVAQQFTSLSSADQRYAQNVQARYQQMLLGAGTCPLLNEDDTYILGEQP